MWLSSVDAMDALGYPIAYIRLGGWVDRRKTPVEA